MKKKVQPGKKISARPKRGPHSFRRDKSKTQEKKSDAELNQEKEASRELESRLWQLAETAFEAVAIHENGILLEVNSPFCRLFGYDRQELIGRPVLDLAAPESRSLILQNIMSGYEEPYEAFGLRKDGTKLIGELRGRAIQYKGRQARVTAIHDITERKRAEESLRKSEARYKDLADSITDVFFAFDHDLRYIYWNKASEILTGVPAKEALGKSLLEVFGDGLDIRYAEKQYREVLDTKRAKTFMNETQLGNRRYFFEISAYPAGQGLSVFVKDITARKHVEADLKKSEERYSIIANSSPNIMFIHRGGTIRYLNDAGTKILGYSKDEAMGKTIFDFLADDSKELAAKNMRRRSAGEDVESYEVQVITKTNETKSFMVNAALIPYEDEQAILVVLADITERKLAEEALRKSEEKYHTVLDQAVDAVFIHDETGRILDVNRKACRSLGYSREELLSKSIGDIDPEAIRAGKDQLWSAVLAGSSETFESRHRCKDGTFFPVEVTLGPVRLSQGPVVVGIARDIAERKRAEAEIFQRSEELAALSALGQKVGRSLELDRVIQDAITEVAKLVKSDLAFFFLREGQELRLKGIAPASGKDMFEGALEHRVGECLCGLAIRLGRALYSRDISTDPRCIWEECKKAGLRSLAALPVREGDEVIGVIGLAARVERDFEPQAGFLETMASQVSSGIRNARLFEKVQQELAERKRVEEELRVSEHKFSKAFRSSPDAVTLSEQESGSLIDVNDGFELVFGYSREEAIGRTILELGLYKNPADRQAMLQILHDQGSVRNLEFIGRHKSGSNLTALLSVEKIEINQKPCLMTIARDITERKRAEELIEKSETKYRSLVETGGAGVATVDLEGRFTFVNLALSTLVGRASEEMLGQPFVNYIHSDDVPEIMKLFAGAAQNPTAKPDLEFRVIHRDGHLIWCHSQPTSLMLQGQLIGFNAIIQDISIRKRREEELRNSREQLRALSARLESAREEEKASVAREIHDELGQKLTGLIMDLSLLTKQIPDSLSPLRARTEAMAKDVDGLIKSVRKISMELRPGILDDLGLVPAIEWLCQDYLERHGIRCNLNLKARVMDISRERSIGVFRVLQEALTNVVRHAQADLVTIALREDAESFFLSIEDNGRGIEPDQASSSGSLGLLGMKERARMMGGEAVINGLPGKGTKVLLRFPKNANR